GYIVITRIGVVSLAFVLAFVGFLLNAFQANFATAGDFIIYFVEGFALLLGSFGISLAELYVRLFTLPLYLALGENFEVTIAGIKVSIKVVIDALTSAIRNSELAMPYGGDVVKYFETVYNALGWSQIDLSWAYGLTGVLSSSLAYKTVSSTKAGLAGGSAKPVIV
ncbi:MAG: hypothetical protein J7L47_05020, partial [Candidatus Odinarchaeota archaeon]|nr:hypothetical protein [Candidatus Odinarchaeota archaeon]